MKVKSLVILLISVIIISSCSKNDDHKYSCDAEVNSFVTENKLILADITFDEIIEYNLKSQKAIFRLLTPEKRHEI